MRLLRTLTNLLIRLEVWLAEVNPPPPIGPPDTDCGLVRCMRCGHLVEGRWMQRHAEVVHPETNAVS